MGSIGSDSAQATPPPPHQPVFTTRVKMLRTVLVASLVLLLVVGCFAPFPPGDPRAFLNPVIEPWWCKVPKIVREYLHLKFTFSPLNERGPCTVPSGRFNG